MDPLCGTFCPMISMLGDLFGVHPDCKNDLKMSTFNPPFVIHPSAFLFCLTRAFQSILCAIMKNSYQNASGNWISSIRQKLSSLAESDQQRHFGYRSRCSLNTQLIHSRNLVGRFWGMWRWSSRDDFDSLNSLPVHIVQENLMWITEREQAQRSTNQATIKNWKRLPLALWNSSALPKPPWSGLNQWFAPYQHFVKFLISFIGLESYRPLAAHQMDFTIDIIFNRRFEFDAWFQCCDQFTHFAWFVCHFHLSVAPTVFSIDPKLVFLLNRWL